MDTSKMIERLNDCLHKLARALSECMDRLAKRLRAIFSACDTIHDIELGMLKPYRCRVCGRWYASGWEAQSCAKMHDISPEAKAYIRGANRRPGIFYTGARGSKQRNREGAYRRTEQRRHRANR